MTDQAFAPFPDTEVDGRDPQDVLEQEYDPATDVDHEPNPDAPGGQQ